MNRTEDPLLSLPGLKTFLEQTADPIHYMIQEAFTRLQEAAGAMVKTYLKEGAFCYMESCVEWDHLCEEVDPHLGTCEGEERLAVWGLGPYALEAAKELVSKIDEVISLTEMWKKALEEFREGREELIRVYDLKIEAEKKLVFLMMKIRRDTCKLRELSRPIWFVLKKREESIDIIGGVPDACL